MYIQQHSLCVWWYLILVAVICLKIYLQAGVSDPAALSMSCRSHTEITSCYVTRRLCSLSRLFLLFSVNLWPFTPLGQWRTHLGLLQTVFSHFVHECHGATWLTCLRVLCFHKARLIGYIFPGSDSLSMTGLYAQGEDWSIRSVKQLALLPAWE